MRRGWEKVVWGGATQLSVTTILENGQATRVLPGCTRVGRSKSDVISLYQISTAPSISQGRDTSSKASKLRSRSFEEVLFLQKLLPKASSVFFERGIKSKSGNLLSERQSNRARRQSERSSPDAGAGSIPSSGTTLRRRA